MEINELLDVVEYSIKNYYNDQAKTKFSLIEYYSLTDIKPTHLEKIAHSIGRNSSVLWLRDFGLQYSWLLQDINVSQRLNNFHAIGNYELTTDDKLSIIDKLKEEGYPLCEGVYNSAARIFVHEGIDAISKEKISKQVTEFYDKTKNFTSKNGMLSEKERIKILKDNR